MLAVEREFIDDFTLVKEGFYHALMATGSLFAQRILIHNFIDIVVSWPPLVGSLSFKIETVKVVRSIVLIGAGTHLKL